MDSIILEERDLAIAEHRYSRRTIFEKICARSLAETKRIAKQEYRAQSYDVALMLYEQVLEKEPKNPRTMYYKSLVLMAQQSWGQAEEWIQKSLEYDVNATYQALFLELLGDIYWQRGERPKAKEQYEKCLSFGLRDAQRRTLLAKIQSLEEPQAKRFFLGRNHRATNIYILMSWNREGTELSSYLTGLQLWSIFELDGAIELLRSSKFETVELEEQRLFMLGKAYVMNHQKELSIPIWKQLADAQQNRIQMEAKEWMRRAN